MQIAWVVGKRSNCPVIHITSERVIAMLSRIAGLSNAQLILIGQALTITASQENDLVNL